MGSPNAKRWRWTKKHVNLGTFWHQNYSETDVAFLQEQTHVNLRRAYRRHSPETTTLAHSHACCQSVHMHTKLPQCLREASARHTPVAGTHKEVQLFFPFPDRPVGQRISHVIYKMNDMCETPTPPEKHLTTALQQDCLSTGQNCSGAHSGSHDLQLARPGSESREYHNYWLEKKKKKSNQESHYRTNLGKLRCLIWEKWILRLWPKSCFVNSGESSIKR